MSHDVFISYSHTDKSYADAVCHYLEQDGIRCWYAPRDIEPGAIWAKSIHEALESSKIFILILSNRSNISEQVIREINLAVSQKLHIITLKVEDVEISKELEYYLGVSHWLDAITKPLDKHLVSLTNYIKSSIPEVQSSQAQNLSGGLKEKKTVKKWYRARNICIFVLLLLVLVPLGYYSKNAFMEYRRSTDKELTLAETNVIFSKQTKMGINFFSPDYKLYAEAEKNGLIFVRDTKTKELIYTVKPQYQTEHEPINCFFAEDNSTLIVMFPKEIEIYDLETGLLLHQSESRTNVFAYAEFIQDDKYVTFLLGRSLMSIYYGENGSDIFSEILTLDTQNWDTVYHYTSEDYFTFYGITLDGKYICSWKGENLLYLHGTVSDQEFYNNDAILKCYNNVNFPPFDNQGKFMQTPYVDNFPTDECSIYRLSDGKIIFQQSTDELSYFRLSDNGRLILCTIDKTTVYDILSEKKVIEVNGYKKWDMFLKYVIPDTTYLVGTQADSYHGKRLIILDTKSNKKISSNIVITNPIYSESGAGLYRYIFTKDRVIYFCETENGLDCIMMDYNLSLFDTAEQDN